MKATKKGKRKHIMKRFLFFFEASWKRLTKSYTIAQQTSEVPE